jgi:hypothetical protein
MSIAKENKLLGESCSWEEKRKSEILPKDKFEYYRSTRSIGLPASRRFPVLSWKERLGGCHVMDRQSLPMGYLLWLHQWLALREWWPMVHPVQKGQLVQLRRLAGLQMLGQLWGLAWTSIVFAEPRHLLKLCALLGSHRRLAGGHLHLLIVELECLVCLPMYPFVAAKQV